MYTGVQVTTAAAASKYAITADQIRSRESSTNLVLARGYGGRIILCILTFGSSPFLAVAHFANRWIGAKGRCTSNASGIALRKEEQHSGTGMTKGTGETSTRLLYAFRSGADSQFVLGSLLAMETTGQEILVKRGRDESV